MNILSIDRNTTEDLMAASLATGNVKLYRWPLQGRGKPFVEGTGHSRMIKKVRFTTNGTHLLTIGGANRAILQYRIRALPTKMESDIQKENAPQF